MVDLIIHTNDKNLKKCTEYQVCVMIRTDALNDLKKREVIKCLLYISSRLLTDVELIEYYISDNHMSMFLKTKRNITTVLIQMLDLITSYYKDIYTESTSADEMWSSATIIPIKHTLKKKTKEGKCNE